MLPFAGILQAPETSSKLSHRLCTAEIRKLQPLSSKLMNMDTSTVVQVAEPAEREVARLRSVRPYPSSCIEREGHGRRAIHGLLTTLDPSLTLTRTQYPAIVGKAGNRKPVVYAGFATPCNPQQLLTAHSS
jgi:hypothetical protein